MKLLYSGIMDKKMDNTMYFSLLFYAQGSLPRLRTRISWFNVNVDVL